MAVRDGDQFDVVVVGRGFVGGVLGLALSQAGVRCLIVEASPETAASPVPRPIALAYGSRKILAGLNLWSEIGRRATPIHSIHVSDRGRFGFARLRAKEYGVDALGYVSDAGHIFDSLLRAFSSCAALETLQPFSIVRAEAGEQEVRIDCAGSEEGQPDIRLRARLLIATDGGQSLSRTVAGISARTVDWQQSAISATIGTRLDHQHVAYERFTSDGPIALLPMGPQVCGLVWTLPDSKAEHIMELDDVAFLSSLQEAFGSRLGTFTHAEARTRHRLLSVHSRSLVKPRFALAGNAANHLHPVAGQGLNLGFRDAAALAEVVVDAIRRGDDPGAIETLRRYADWRTNDQRLTSEFTASIVRLFSNDFLPMAAVRDIGLIGFDSFGFLKSNLARHAMGVSGRSSRLARGLPL